MSDRDEWQKSEAQRRGGPAGDHPYPRQPVPEPERGRHLTEGQIERIEEEVRDEVAATDPAISDS
jgi:hypothetical protein